MSYNSPFSGAEVDDAVTKRHEKNKDTKLDEGGANETTAQETRAHIDSTANPHGVTKTQVGLGNVDNVSAADLRDRSTHTGTQTLSTISDAGTIASQDANNVNIDGGTIDGTAIGSSSASSGAFTTLDTSGIATIGTPRGDAFNNDAKLRISADAGKKCFFQLKSDNDQRCAILFGNNDDDVRGEINYDNNTDAMYFNVNDSNEAMRIDSSGNVGIGTTSPSELLDVAGPTKIGKTQIFSDGVGAISTSQSLRFAISVNRALESYLCKVSVQFGAASNTTTTHPAAEYIFRARVSSNGDVSYKNLTASYEFGFDLATDITLTNAGSNTLHVDIANPAAITVDRNSYKVEIVSSRGVSLAASIV